MRAGLVDMCRSRRVGEFRSHRTLLIDFKIGTAKKIRWELLDRKTDGFGGGGEALVAGVRGGLARAPTRVIA